MQESTVNSFSHRKALVQGRIPKTHTVDRHSWADKICNGCTEI